MSFRLSFLIILIFVPRLVLSEETTTSTPLQITITPSPAQIAMSRLPEFPPRCDRFVEPTKINNGYNYQQVDQCANAQWVPSMECPNEDQVKRGTILMGMAETIINAHNYRHSLEGTAEGFTYEPRLLVCKMFKESTFRPQAEAPGSGSSAAGLSMITRSTCRALMSGFHGERLNFFSRIPRFNHIEDGDELYEAMSSSIALQIEVGLAVLQLKNLEGTALNNVTVSGVRQLLELYYGSGKATANAAYAQDIINCSSCIRDNNNQVNYSCLLKAQGRESGTCP